MAQLVLGTKAGETIVVTCSCGCKVELSSLPKDSWRRIRIDAPPEIEIHREPKTTRLIEEGSK